MSSTPSEPERKRRSRRAAVPSPDGAFIEAGGVPVHYRRFGSGPPVVLLHGAGGNLRDFTLSLAPEIARRHEVIAVDRPGLGFSGRTWRARQLSGQALLLAEALAALGVERPTLVGHSYGGALALAWALALPGTVAGALVIGAPSQPRGRIGLMNGLLASHLTGPIVARQVPDRIADRLVGNALVRIFSPQPVPPGYLAHMRPELVLSPAVLRANALQLRALKTGLRAIAPRYTELAVPVEIVHGAADGIVPFDVHALPLARQVPGARLTRLEGVGHMPQHAATDEILAALGRLTG
jgi:pimeloyl-ACP methyl ester carboxylesterase